MYVVFEARLVLALFDAFLGYGHTASARLVELVYKFEHGKHTACVGVGTEEGSELLVYLSGLEDTGQILVGNADAGVGLAVLKQNVVARVVLLYKTVLKQQSILLGVYDGVADVLNLRHQHLGLEPVYLLVEVA